MNNPFSVKTPETLKPEEVARLFIDVFSDFPRMLTPEHTFLHGSRGTGKSMMLRYLEPHVQLAANNVNNASELRYYAIHMPIKKANYGLSELERLDGAAYWLLSEHILTSNAVIHILDSLISLSKRDEESENAGSENWDKFCTDFVKLADSAGCDTDFNEGSNSSESLQCLRDIILDEHRETLHYLRKLTFSDEFFPYTSALFGYIDFLLPFLKLVTDLTFTPVGPVYLMVDDADNLPERMQKVVNSWVSYRSTDQICLKITTQQRYKTWRTVQGISIESPHDYSEIDINTVYTSKKWSHYYSRIEKVVEKRLEVNNFNNTSPTEFFPANPNQEIELNLIAENIKSNWEKGLGISARKNDDVTRYKTSDYMKQLAKSKKTNTFSYSGFRSIVDISSGIIRFFLEPASRMYNEVLAGQESEQEVTHIPHAIQDKVLTEWSKEFMGKNFDALRMTGENKDEVASHQFGEVDKLRNLVVSFGNLFQAKFRSNDTERRFLSFMPTDTVDHETQKILDIAIERGYLYKSSIGSKEGIGRKTLYVLNRRLTPFFKLDPSGYAAHMSVTPDDLALATHSPRKFVSKRLESTDNNQDQNSIQTDLLISNGDES